MIEVLIEETVPRQAAGLDPLRIQKAAETTLAFHNISLQSHHLTIVITNDEAIAALNRQYRQVDAPTDVLSFTANEVDPQDGLTYLGDVIISYERARDNLKQRLAEWQASDLERELILLTVHGVLHILGYDHAEPAGEVRMWAQQDLIIQKIG